MHALGLILNLFPFNSMALKSTNKHRRNSALHWFWKKSHAALLYVTPIPLYLVEEQMLLACCWQTQVYWISFITAMASQINSLTVDYSTVYSGADQRKHQSSVSLAFVWRIHRGPVTSSHKWPVTRKCLHLMTSSCWNLKQMIKTTQIAMLPRRLPGWVY